MQRYEILEKLSKYHGIDSRLIKETKKFISIFKQKPFIYTTGYDVIIAYLNHKNVIADRPNHGEAF